MIIVSNGFAETKLTELAKTAIYSVMWSWTQIANLNVPNVSSKSQRALRVVAELHENCLSASREFVIWEISNRAASLSTVALRFAERCQTPTTLFWIFWIFNFSKTLFFLHWKKNAYTLFTRGTEGRSSLKKINATAHRSKQQLIDWNTNCIFRVFLNREVFNDNSEQWFWRNEIFRACGAGQW